MTWTFKDERKRKDMLGRRNRRSGHDSIGGEHANEELGGGTLRREGASWFSSWTYTF